MRSDLTPARRRFLEVLAAHPDGLPAADVPQEIGFQARQWCRRNALARCARLPPRCLRWRITGYGRAALSEPEARP